MSLIPCPAGRALASEDPDYLCPTMLQPYRGRLTEGVAEHLRTVHQLPDDKARAVATSWVESDGRWAHRAKR
jgi:hypothetical protein